MARNRVIGRDNALPWKLPDEMRYFMRTTLGKPVIMGRRQWEAMDKPLAKRTNIVITRNRDYVANGAVVAHDLDEALERAREIEPDCEAMVIGGAEIYALALPIADRLYYTSIDADIDGDVRFPEFDERSGVRCRANVTNETNATRLRTRFGCWSGERLQCIVSAAARATNSSGCPRPRRPFRRQARAGLLHPVRRSCATTSRGFRNSPARPAHV